MDGKRTLLEVLDTRTVNGRIEGLCSYSDGSQEWREPSSVQVEIVNDRTGEQVPVSDVTLTGTGS